MRLVLVLGLLVSSCVCNSAFADESGDTKSVHDTSWFIPAVSVGFSYPLVFSGSVGVLLPLDRQDEDSVFPTSPSLRIDCEVGLGGGSAAVGLYTPVGSSFAINLKLEHMRTWFRTWGEQANRTFDGGVAEFVLLGHIPAKVGLGYFRDTEVLNNRRESFTYIFFGVGW